MQIHRSRQHKSIPEQRELRFAIFAITPAIKSAITASATSTDTRRNVQLVRPDIRSIRQALDAVIISVQPEMAGTAPSILCSP